MSMAAILKSSFIQVTSAHHRVFRLVCGSPPYLYPWHYQWLATRDVNRCVAQVLTRLEGKILDVGCGMQPYRHHLGPSAVYVGLDIVPNRGVDLLLDPGAPFPVGDNEFDAILCTQVLEHVEELDFFLAEVARVLKPGGKLVLSVPFIYHVHGKPHDYRRFSEFGVRAILPNYDVEYLERQGGIGSSMVILFLCWLENQLGATVVGYLIKILLSPALIALSFLMNMIGLLLDKLDTTNTCYGNLFVLARLRLGEDK